jgi:hypothetical protein
LADTGLPLKASFGGRITYNRALDGACVGEVGTLIGLKIPSTETKASGSGDDCRTTLTAYAFPAETGVLSAGGSDE